MSFWSSSFGKDSLTRATLVDCDLSVTESISLFLCVDLAFLISCAANDLRTCELAKGKLGAGRDVPSRKGCCYTLPGLSCYFPERRGRKPATSSERMKLGFHFASLHQEVPAKLIRDLKIPCPIARSCLGIRHSREECELTMLHTCVRTEAIMGV